MTDFSTKEPSSLLRSLSELVLITLNKLARIDVVRACPLCEICVLDPMEKAQQSVISARLSEQLRERGSKRQRFCYLILASPWVFLHASKLGLTPGDS